MKQAGVAGWKWSAGPDKASFDQKMVLVIMKRVQPGDTGVMTGRGVRLFLLQWLPLKCRFGAATPEVVLD